ncbi:MAG: DUF1684 domain-containing protein [Myxococcota bacterium]
MTRGRVGGALVAMLSTAACGEPQLPAGWTTEESMAFQREHDAAIGAQSSPLSAIASHYVSPGDSLTLGVVDGTLVTDTGGEGPTLRLEVTDAGARCLTGCGPEPLALTERKTLSLGRFILETSPQSGTLRVVAHDPKAPARVAYKGVPWFSADASFIVPARFEPDPAGASVELSTTRGLTKAFERAGVFEAKVQGKPIRLVGYGSGEPGQPLLVPLTDETSGTDSYPVGRYLQVVVPSSGPAVLDFNRLTNPWCAYSEHYNCPVPPADNAVPVALEGGEKIFGPH